MKPVRILRYSIRICCFLWTIALSSQEIGVRSSIKKDTVVYPRTYGIRVGADLWGLFRGDIYNEKGRALLINADYRIKRDLYVYLGLGTEDKTRVQDFYTYKTSGQFFKLGVDWNIYKNWMDMDNEIYIGIRYGFATFQHRLESYQIFQRGTKIGQVSDTYFPVKKSSQPEDFKGLNAHWVEFVAGTRVELFKNFYMGVQMGIYRILSAIQPKGFANLYIPGFNTVFEGGVGAGFQYQVSYRIPLFKR